MLGTLRKKKNKKNNKKKTVSIEILFYFIVFT